MPVLVSQRPALVDYQHMGQGLASLVRYRRSQRGWNRPYAAQRIGITVPYLEQIENGRRTSPSLKVIMALCATFSIHPKTMLEAWQRGIDAKASATAE